MWVVIEQVGKYEPWEKVILIHSSITHHWCSTTRVSRNNLMMTKLHACISPLDWWSILHPRHNLSFYQRSSWTDQTVTQVTQVTLHLWEDLTLTYRPKGHCCNQDEQNQWSILNTSNLLDYGGFHCWSDLPTAQAEFVFTGTLPCGWFWLGHFDVVGIAIYFISPLWPYTVVANLSVDLSSGTVVSLQDTSTATTDGGLETVNLSAVWGQSGLANGQHTLTVLSAMGNKFVVLDVLMWGFSWCYCYSKWH